MTEKPKNLKDIIRLAMPSVEFGGENFLPESLVLKLINGKIAFYEKGKCTCANIRSSGSTFVKCTRCHIIRVLKELIS